MKIVRWVMAMALLGVGTVWAADVPVAAWPVVLTGGDGAEVSLPVAGCGATVLVFVTPGCPMANRYAPTLAAIAKEFEGQARFYRVYAGAEVTAADMAAHEKAYAYGFPGLRDPEQHTVVRCDATRTPEIAVIDEKGVVRYRGAVDDRYADFGKYRQTATKEYLRDALTAVLAGKEVAVARTQALGCFIPEKEVNAEALRREGAE